ncbi:MAG TPA: FecR family protein [Polyangiaceae bacterium]|nr:FecR family protein [Polyangiaceae bacterium]
MSTLDGPLRHKLSVEVDARTSLRVWRNTNELRKKRALAERRRSLAGAFAVGVTFAVVVLFALRTPEPRATAALSTEGPAKLRVKGGGEWDGVVSAAAPAAIDFEDGSKIALNAGGRLMPLENNRDSFVLFLGAGQASFDVKPGGTRRWSIEAGLATVEVVGTSFVVNRTPTALVVEVTRGVVLVRGERLVDRVQRLEAGNRLEIPAAQPVTTAEPRESPPPKATMSPQPEPPHANAAGAWRDLAARGDYAEAYRSLEANGIAQQSRTADLDRLLALADVARLSGHPRDAVEPLQRVVVEHRHDPRAALAAFTLGRVHLDSLGNARAAASDFRDAIALGLSPALLEDAYLRLVEAFAKAGDRRAAHEAWRAYGERFPHSPRRATVDQWGREP